MAPLIYRASPIDPTLRTPSTHQDRDLSPYRTTPSADGRVPSPLPSIGHEISRPSSASTYQHLQQHHNNHNIALPALSTLASVASAPSPQLRCVISYVACFKNANATREGLSQIPLVCNRTPCRIMLMTGCDHRAYNNASHNMTYAASSPAATPGVSGNVPVSWHLLLLVSVGSVIAKFSTAKNPYRFTLQTWLHLLTMNVGIYSLYARTARLRQHRCGAEMRLGRSCATLAAFS